MKLVSIYIHFFSLLFFLGWDNVQAQKVWTLEQCIDTAQLYNKSLQISRNHIVLGTEKEKEAKASLIPRITANTDYRYFMELPTQLMPMNIFNPQVPEGQFKEARFGVPHNFNANVQLAMPLYNPQLYGAIQNTKITGELTRLQYKQTEEQVLYDITTLYYNAQIILHQLAFIDSNLVNTNTLLKSMELLKDQLLAKGTDVSKVKLQAEQLNTLRVNIGNKYILVLNALKLNMGIDLENELTVEPEIYFQTGTAYAPKLSLDVRLIQAQNRLLNSEMSTLNKSRYLPSLSLVASYGASGFGYDKKPNDFLKFYPIGFAGLQLTYPLFSGTVTQRKIAQKKLELRNNGLQEQLITEKSRMEIDNTTRQRGVAQLSVVNTESQITLAQTIYNQTVLQQKMGTASLTDVLLAENAVREAQQNYLSAVIDYLKADLELRKLTGVIKN